MKKHGLRYLLFRDGVRVGYLTHVERKFWESYQRTMKRLKAATAVLPDPASMNAQTAESVRALLKQAVDELVVLEAKAKELGWDA